MLFLMASAVSVLAVFHVQQSSGSQVIHGNGDLQFDFYGQNRLFPPNDTGNGKNKSVNAQDKMDCIFACVNVSWCRSVNFKTTPDASGLHLCELLALDQHNNTLNKSTEFHHYSIKSQCRVNESCLNGAECIAMDRHSYRCNCKQGFEGPQCEKDIDECLTGQHNCNVNATCSNKVGSYVCICKPGYRADGSCSTAKSCLEGAPENFSTLLINPDSQNEFVADCDMNTDGGGWTLVSNHVIPSSGLAPTIKVIDKYSDWIAHYNTQQTVISRSVLTKLKSLTSFTQIRWHCHKARVGRTIDIISAKDSLGETMVQYFTTDSTTKYVPCGSYYTSQYDTSYLSQNCNKWDEQYLDKTTFVHPFYISSTSHFLLTSNRRECDDWDLDNKLLSPGDFWKVYIR